MDIVIVKHREYVKNKIYQTGDKTYQTGDKVIIEVGSLKDYGIILKKNQVGEEIPIVTLEENEFVGELSLFDTKARLTSVRCSGECTFLVITHNDIERLIHESPTIALSFIKALISRMRCIILKQTEE